ncbi:hypothetical protein [Mesorhizobium sp. INR15]|uniref:hypothetical protein n=1 Tax=Mesorhizobium sp. INR15 TaxID=2654248 RepID=UPI0018967C6C|nr:hypothetical protein [Mesorhizobium sp. INR15]QPC91459.1 hypothetical protein GA829_13030 [Mesorhizobium sp. INR15]
MNDDPHLTMADLRVLYCVKGVKKHLEGAGVDFPKFIREGAKASELRGHGFDAQIDRAVEMIRDRGSSDGR